MAHIEPLVLRLQANISPESLAAARSLADSLEGTLSAARALLATLEKGPVATLEGTGENLVAPAGTAGAPEPSQAPESPTEPRRRAEWLPGFSNTAN